MIDTLLSQQLDEYRLKALLGQGGMARVYRGFDVHLKRRAAIKVIDTPYRTDPVYVMRFEREAQAIAQLKHPHIVGVYRYGKADGLLYIAMEYIEGTDLETVLATYGEDQELIQPEDASRIIREVCSALDYAHSKGVIHRDLKPNNIMFSPNRHVVLTDFGIAHITGVPSYTMANVLLGTPAYMSPEQAQGERVDERSDIYSLGVILYEIATGRVPFESDTPIAIIMKLVSGSWPLPTAVNPALPEAVEHVILTAMSKDPTGRYQTATDMAQALQQALGHSLLAAAAVTSAPTGLTQIVPLTTPFQPGSGAAEKSGPALVDGDTITVGNISGGYVAIGPGAQVTLVSQSGGSGDIARLFEVIYRQIEARPEDPNVDKEELIEIVMKIQREVARGEHAKPNKVKRWLDSLTELASDICKAMVAGLIQPSASVPAPIRQIAAQAGPAAE